MEFTNTFTIPVDVDHAFEVLTDLERVAPCMPGAKLETVDGDVYTGRVKVKVGPMSLTYRGTAEVVDKDPQAHTATIAAKGNEARGGGTANADVTASLTAVDDGTEVVVTTNLDITGKPAQFGRGVMADVGVKIIDKFADCLSRRLAEGEPDAADEAAAPTDTSGDDSDSDDGSDGADASGAGDDGSDGADASGAEGDDADAAGTASSAAVAAGASAAATAPSQSTSSGPRRVVSSEPESEALDILGVAGGATIKRGIPLLAALTVIGLIIWWFRRD